MVNFDRLSRRKFMICLDSKTGNGCFWLGRDNDKYLVKVEDGISLDPNEKPITFDSARKAYDTCLDQYWQADGMERHAWWNACHALQENVFQEENIAA
jgi:hypothetical protein